MSVAIGQCLWIFSLTDAMGTFQNADKPEVTNRSNNINWGQDVLFNRRSNGNWDHDGNQSSIEIGIMTLPRLGQILETVSTFPAFPSS